MTGTTDVLSGSDVIFGAPLPAEPGTRFEHGITTDRVGKVVEAASGLGPDVTVTEGITGPRGMDEASFAPSAEQ